MPITTATLNFLKETEMTTRQAKANAALNAAAALRNRAERIGIQQGAHAATRAYKKARAFEVSAMKIANDPDPTLDEEAAWLNHTPVAPSKHGLQPGDRAYRRSTDGKLIVCNKT
jgi:hypothetical protein